MESDINLNLPQPFFKPLSRDVNKVYCEVCCKNWDKRNTKRVKLVKLDKTKFSILAKSWALVEHHFNEVYGRVDWTGAGDMFCCRSCYSMFFKEGYLQNQKPLEENVFEDEGPSELTPPPQTPPPVSIRSSLRKKISYETQRDCEEKKQCVICCTVKKDTKGRIIPVTIITLRNVESKKHVAEETLVNLRKSMRNTIPNTNKQPTGFY